MKTCFSIKSYIAFVENLCYYSSRSRLDRSSKDEVFKLNNYRLNNFKLNKSRIIGRCCAQCFATAPP